MKTLEAVRTNQTISIDGRLDETAWASAAVVEDLHQILPVEYAEPSQRTRFLVLYDSEALYVAGEMYDTEPELLTAKVLRQGGDPDNPDVRRKSNSLTFVPSDLPGVYRATTSGDALAGQPLAWAYVDGYTLTVHSLVVLDGGGYVMQTYHRTLSDMGMALEFISIKNGETARRVEGRLTKRIN